jgi:hypothetical protein
MHGMGLPKSLAAKEEKKHVANIVLITLSARTVRTKSPSIG